MCLYCEYSLLTLLAKTSYLYNDWLYTAPTFLIASLLVFLVKDLLKILPPKRDSFFKDVFQQRQEPVKKTEMLVNFEL